MIFRWWWQWWWLLLFCASKPAFSCSLHSWQWSNHFPETLYK